MQKHIFYITNDRKIHINGYVLNIPKRIKVYITSIYLKCLILRGFLYQTTICGQHGCFKGIKRQDIINYIYIFIALIIYHFHLLGNTSYTLYFYAKIGLPI